MTEEEAFKALARKILVQLVRAGGVYEGRLMAKYGSMFIFKGNKGSEQIEYRGYPREFSLSKEE